MHSRFYRLVQLAAAFCCAATPALAQDATWLASPGSGDFSNGANWSTGTVPTGTASFGASTTTTLGSSADITIGALEFNANAPRYSFAPPDFTNITFTGAGIINNSAQVPRFDNELFISFLNSSSAGNAAFFSTPGSLTFQNTSNAGTATIQTSNSGVTTFKDSASASNATLTISGTGTLKFLNQSTASTSTIINAKGETDFGDSGGGGTDTANAGNATIVNQAGTGIELSGGVTYFYGFTTAGNATITTQSKGGVVFFENSTGGQARFITEAGGEFDMSQIAGTGITAGSIEGGGTYFLGGKTLTVGGNNLSTTVTGIVRDGTCGCFGPGGSGASLVKTGSGTLTLDGVNAYTGTTTINGGALQIGNSLTPSASIATPVAVNAGGTLMGYGTIAGAVTNMTGTLRPGGPGGTLHVTGAYTQGASGNLTIEVSPSSAGKLVATGAANLSGTLSIVYDPGTYGAKTYQIVAAGGGVSGTFATVSGTAPVATVTQSVSYAPNEVDLALGDATVRPSGATVFNDPASASADTTFTASDYLFARLDSVENGNDNSDVVSRLSHNLPIQVASASGNLAQLNAGTLPGRIGTTGGWFRALGTLFSAHGEGAAPAYTANTGGFLAGIDRRFGVHAIAGIALGYSHTDIAQNDGSSGGIDTPRVSFYGNYSFGKLDFAATAGAAYDRINTTRPVPVIGATATQAHNGFEGNGALQASYTMALDGFIVTPRAGLRYLYVSENGFSESGASGFDLSNGGRNTRSLQPVIGASVAKSYRVDDMTIIPEMKLLYARELMTTSRNIALTTTTGAGIVAQGVTPAHNTVTAGPAITLRAADDLDLYADYKLTLGIGKSVAHTLFAGARKTF